MSKLISCSVGYFPGASADLCWRVRVKRQGRDSNGGIVVYKFNNFDFEMYAYFWASWGRRIAGTARGCSGLGGRGIPVGIFTSLYNGLTGEVYDDVFEEMVGYSGRTGQKVMEDGCSVMGAFRFSEDILERIRKKKGKARYVALEPRVAWAVRDEVIQAELDRCEFNKKAGLAKGFYSWYLTACEEEARLLKKSFGQKDRERVVKEFWDLYEARQK